MTKTARDVMQTHVVKVSEDDPLSVVERLFFEEGIHGAPVVDDDGQVKGVISATDLLRAVSEEHDISPSEPAYFREDLDFSHFSWGRAPEDFKERLNELTVADYMTNGAVTVRPDTEVTQIARTLRENQIHRVLVVEDGLLRGIVSSFDLVALLESDSAH